MSTTVTTRSEIPDAPFYVLSNDRFMSGWGEAHGMLNTLICPCQTAESAEFVKLSARMRKEQSRVHIVKHKPQLYGGRLYSLMSADSASAWYGLYFKVARETDPADGLRVTCPELDAMCNADRHAARVLTPVRRAADWLHSGDNQGNGKLHNLMSVIAFCSEVASIAGAETISIYPE